MEYNVDKGLFLFTIETKSRDFDSRLWLSLNLINEGYSIILGSKGGVNKCLDLLKSDSSSFVYVSKATIDAYKHEKKIHGKNGIIYILDEEGGIYKRSWDSLYYRNPYDKLIKMDHLLLWGSKQKDLLDKKFKLGSQINIHVTGHPRFDLAKTFFDNYHRGLFENKDLVGVKDYLLINTAFGRSNHVLGFEHNMKNMKEQLGDILDIELKKREFDYQSRVFGEFLKMVRFLSKKFPEIFFVVRPHPIEDITIYQKELKNLKNVIITRKGSVQSWIADALGVIHHDCTTGIESFMNGKPTISYQPYFDEELVQWLPPKISDVVKDKTTLVNKIKQIRNKSYSCPDNENKIRLVKEIIDNVDSNSTTKIIELFKDHNLFSLDSNLKIKVGFFKRFVFKLLNLYAIFRNLFLHGYEKKKHFRTKNKFPYLKKEEITKRIELFKECDSSLKDVKVKKLLKNTFLLTPGDE